MSDTEAYHVYPRFRWRIMEATFFGYAFFYLLRNNLSVVSKDIGGALHYDHAMLGNLLAITSISYGVGKFVMGTLSDRSNPRVFMAIGLLLTALCNFAFGSVSSYPLHLILWGLNGFIQGMGWPPCGRSMGHWFSKEERGLTFSVWNTSHNLGGGLAGILAAWAVSTCGGWQYAFLLPGVLALFGSFYLFWRLCDTPQSVGLPPIEEYAALKRRVRKTEDDAPSLSTPQASHSLNPSSATSLVSESSDASLPTPQASHSLNPSPATPLVSEPSDASLPTPLVSEVSHERELTFREILVVHVLTNKMVWLLAFANFFAYIARYSMLDWGPMYLRDVKQATLVGGGIAILMTEFGGIPSTILFGWLSDRLEGRRGMVAVLCMIPILGAFAILAFTPPGYLWLDMLMLAMIGFFIYPVINLIVIMALDLTSKKAIGAAAGFIGLFGYLGRTFQAWGFGGLLKHQKAALGLEGAWFLVITLILVCTGLAILFLAFTWKLRPHDKKQAA